MIDCVFSALGKPHHKHKHKHKLKLRNMTTGVCALLCGRLMDAYQTVQVRSKTTNSGRKSEGLSFWIKEIECQRRNERKRENENKDTGGAWEPPKITSPCCYSTQAGGTVIFVKPARGITEKGRRSGANDGTPRSTAMAMFKQTPL